VIRLRLAIAYLVASVVTAVLSLLCLVYGIKHLLFAKSLLADVCYVAAAVLYGVTSYVCYRRYSRMIRYVKYEPD